MTTLHLGFLNRQPKDFEILCIVIYNAIDMSITFPPCISNLTPEMLLNNLELSIYLVIGDRI